LTCYFNQSFDFVELKELVREFRTEPEEIKEKLLKELNELISTGDWEHVRNYIEKYGSRSVDNDKAKWIVETIIKGLRE
jgi:hypothetical protein